MTAAFAYRFGTADQWAAGIAFRLEGEADGALVPLAPFGGAVVLFPAAAGALPAITPDGAILWSEEMVLRWRGADGITQTAGPIAGLAGATRLVAGRRWLWAAAGAALLRIDLVSLTLDRSIEPAAPLRDISGDGRDGLWCLLEDGRIEHRGADACLRDAESLPAPAGAAALAALRVPTRLVALVGGDLVRIDPAQPPEGAPARPGQVGTDDADLLAGNGRDRLFVARRGETWLRMLDERGALLAEADLAAELGGAGIEAIAARGTSLVVSGGGRLLVHAVERDGPAIGAAGLFVTPALHSPPHGSIGGWSGADLTGDLPTGATLTVRAVTTSDPSVFVEIDRAWRDGGLSVAERWQAMGGKGNVLPSWTSVGGKDAVRDFAVPLFGAGEWLWLAIELQASVAGERPRLRTLAVRYPDDGLTRHLPTIFTADPSGNDPRFGDPTGFFHQLVALLGATTAGIDEEIADLGEAIRAETASEAMLALVASWLGLPWDAALPLDRKRALLAGAEAFVSRRGSRAGLIELLGRLLPSATIRIRDWDVDAPARRLGGRRHGDALPLFLPGLSNRQIALSRKGRIGSGRLTCSADDREGVEPWRRHLLVEIAADADTRSLMEPILAGLLAPMVPAGLRLRLVWRADGKGGPRLDGGTAFDPPLRLGGAAGLGSAPVGAGRGGRLLDQDLDAGVRLN